MSDFSKTEPGSRSNLDLTHHAFLETMPMMKLTPVLTVDRIEDSLAFWQDKLGFTRTIELPEGDKLGFAAITKGNVEIMFQTPSMAAEDAGEMFTELKTGAAQLYIEVEDVDAVQAMLKDVSPALGPRTMFYGMREIGYVEPGGHFVMFATRTEKPQE